ncbi:MAG: hypothetical protein RI911_665 [Candidatus Parcubacteria bacterium]
MESFKQKEVIGALVGVFLLGGALGHYVMPSSNGTPTGNAQFSGRDGGQRGPGMGGRGGQRGAGFAAGEVIAKDETSITVKMQDGSTKIILVTESTEVMNAAKGTIADVVIGKNVMVNGAPNQDGSVTAQSLNIRPAGMSFPMRGQMSPPAPTTQQ